MLSRREHAEVRPSRLDNSFVFRSVFRDQLPAKLQHFPETQGLFEKYPQKMSAFFVVECFFPTFAPNKPTKHNEQKKKLTHKRHT